MIHLSDLSVGEKARILGYKKGDVNYRRKLLSMGLTPGTEVTVIGIAPLGDPIEILIRGLFLGLRKAEAKILKLEKLSL